MPPIHEDFSWNMLKSLQNLEKSTKMVGKWEKMKTHFLVQFSVIWLHHYRLRGERPAASSCSLRKANIMIGMPIGTLEPCHKTKGSIGKLWFVCIVEFKIKMVNWVLWPMEERARSEMRQWIKYIGTNQVDFGASFISVSNLNYTQLIWYCM